MREREGCVCVCVRERESYGVEGEGYLRREDVYLLPGNIPRPTFR